VIALLAFSVSTVVADEPKANKGEAVKMSKLEKAPTATTVDFAGSLKLPFTSLSSLGARIEQNRLEADPVGLASAAHELGVAEKVSGKKASLTADALKEEVVGLAKLRNQSKELEAVSLLLDDEHARADLQKLAQAAKKRESEEAAALREGEKGRGLQGTLTIVNLHDIGMRVYVNGVYRGVTPAFQKGYYYVNNPPGTVSVFEVRYPDGSSRARWVLSEDVPSFRWNIDPNIP